ncbi:hypothetical protein Tco_0879162 [Tanacetum coccineum]
MTDSNNYFLSWKLMVLKYQLRMQIISFSDLCPQHGPICSSNEVSLCSKTCIDSYNTLKTLCDEQMNQLGYQEAQILAYSQAVKKLEGVPYPLSGDYTPKPQEEIDESLYAEPSVSDDRSSEYSTCQSNDSA